MDNASSYNSSAHSPIISDEVLFWTVFVGAVGIGGIMSLFGVVTNVINIIVFIRQGVMGDSSTVSLFGLAISDLMCEVTLVWWAGSFWIFYFPPTGLPYYPMDILIQTAAFPHVTFTLITRYMTTLISFERCVCVLFPFKVKTWFTPHKTVAVVVFIYAVVLLLVPFPKYLVDFFRWEKDPTTNRSMLTPYNTGLVSDLALNTLNFVISYTAMPLSMLLVLVFTQATAIRVNKSRRWRKSTALPGIQNAAQNSTKGNNTETSKKTDGAIGMKDKRLVNMIRVICIVFLVCFTPDLIIKTSEVSGILPPEGNLFFLLYIITFILEALNSGTNFFIYYNMSTRYRTEFRKLIGRKELKTDTSNLASGL